MKTVGDRIREKRIELGLSQEEVAKRMGLSGRSSVTRLEKSEDITLKNVKRIADALGCSYSYIMGWEDEEISAKVAADLLDDPEMVGYVSKLMRLDEKSKKQIYSLIDLLLTK